jgi:spermidine synthase
MVRLIARACCILTIFIGPLLLLLVQPILAKAVLPWFGGSAGVWTTSMLFFQALLLVGYLYAHGLQYLPRIPQMLAHGSLLTGALLAMPLGVSVHWMPEGGSHPARHILILLLASAGLPYLALATTTPVVQAWYAKAFHAQLPYRLFAISNFGSLLGLLLYPFIIEPLAAVPLQMQGWTAAFLLYLGLYAGSMLLTAQLASDWHLPRLPLPSRAWTWLVLAAVPSVLWLAAANHLSQDVAAVPFLWVLPLATYLFTFVLCFDADGWYRPRLFRWILPLGWLAIVFAVGQRGWVTLAGTALLLLLGLFLCCMFCHGELARLRPPAEELTAYYLTIAAGGALGGLFVGAVAPALFREFLELPLGVLACVMLALWLLYNLRSTRVLRIGAVTGAAVVAVLLVGDENPQYGIKLRNFYGILQVEQDEEDGEQYRTLYNGVIQHGLQFMSAERSRIPTSYYSPVSGVALTLNHLQKRGPVRVGVIGLGVGTMAAYAGPDDYFRFYEINPEVIRLARSEFRYLQEAKGKVDILEGDARLTLEREPPQNYDLLAVDAFSGDSIPVHLLTVEAFRLYFRHLKPGGAIAVHVTNKHLELAPVVREAAEALDAKAHRIVNTGESARKIYSSSWVMVTRVQELSEKLSALDIDIDEVPELQLWTDSYSNLLRILK